MSSSICLTNALRGLALAIGSVAIGNSGLLAQAATQPTAPTPPPAAPAVVAKPTASEGAAALDGEAITLSPFEVVSTNKGYQASNTMAGTRINSKLEDLAASISVVTKQQLDDNASIDINDIFRFEANTEGMAQYTEFVVDRGFYNETTTLNPQSSNRIRGIGAANVAVNNFATSATVPVDTYNVSAVEISRGPNANIFGLGSAAGTVNLITGQARLDKNVSQIVGRTDSYGGWRSSLDLNRVLKNGAAAIRVAAVHDDKGFKRKPSYESINRITAGFTVKPTRTTTLRASYETYYNRFSRANTTLPRDGYTEWRDNGKPVWNPTYTTGGATGAWRFLNGTTYTPVATANEQTALPLGLRPGTTAFWANPSVFIEPNGAVTFYGSNAAASALTSPAVAATPVFRYVESGTIYQRSGNALGYPRLVLFQPLSITDKSVYDYTSVNFLSPNYGRDKANIYQGELEQWIVDTPRHRAVLQLGYYREVIDRYDHAVFSRSDSATPFLSVDVNETFLDGTPNPNFLRPYMGGSQPQTKWTDMVNSNARATLAYQLDLTNEGGWLGRLGHHSFALYGERRDLVITEVQSRDLNITDYAWTSANDRLSLPLRGNVYRLYPRYYLGDQATSGRIFDTAPASRFYLGGQPLTWFNSNRGRVPEPATFNEVIQSGNARDREIRTLGATWQGFFWKDRVIPTVGWRQDKNRERRSRNLNSNPLSATQPTSSIDDTTRLHDLSRLKNFPLPWEEKQGKTYTAGAVFKALPWIFLNYNQSDSFNPVELKYNINTLVLPNPTGKTKDYGVTLNVLNNKLVARVTRYESVEKNSRNGSITAAAVTRTLRLFFDPRPSGAPTQSSGLPLPTGQDAFDLEQSATQWMLQQNPTWSVVQAQQAAVDTYFKPMGIDQDFIERARIVGDENWAEVNTVTSQGWELELTYNPNRFWTMKVTGAQQKAVDTELGNAVNDFINSRLVALQKIIVPATPVTTANGTAGRQWWESGATSPTAANPSDFYLQNVKSVIGLATANAGKPRPQTREYSLNFTTNYQLAGISDQGWLKNAAIGGSARWASKAAISYRGSPSTDPTFDGAIVEYDPNRPIYDKQRTYFDLMASYKLKITEKIRCKLQLNVDNVFESGRLQAIAYNPDGTAWNHRIVDPRRFILTASFDL